MKRLFPSPPGSLVVAVLWLVLSASIEPGQILLAAILGVALPLVLRRFGLAAPRVARWGAALRLGWIVLRDVVVANVAVLRLVLLRRRDRINPGFVVVPLATRDPVVASLFGMIITMTPGTVSCRVRPDRGHILVHVLDLGDAQATVDDMKTRYERPLMEIFGC